jgi:hypothetical protein
MLWNLAFLAAFVATVLAVASLCSWAQIRYRLSRGARTEGIVTGHRKKTYSVGPPTWQVLSGPVALVRYQDPSGREHTVEARDRPVGTRVTILYSPRWPHRGWEELPAKPVGLLRFGLITFAFVAGLVVAAALTR